MKKASITETKNRLSALIDEVREGETLLILDRGRPVARMESVVGAEEGAPGRLARLERKGHLRRAKRTPPTGVMKRRPPRAAGGASALAALLAERESGR